MNYGGGAPRYRVRKFENVIPHCQQFRFVCRSHTHVLELLQLCIVAANALSTQPRNQVDSSNLLI